MSIYNTTRCIGGKITYPLHDVGDVDHKILHFKCIIDADQYSPLTSSPSVLIGRDDVPATAASVIGVDVLPDGFLAALETIGGSAQSAYFVEDTKIRKFKGPIVSFDRKFATVPSSRTVGEGTSWTYPEIRNWYEDKSSNDVADYNTALRNQAAGITPPLIKRPQKTFSVTARVTYSYGYSSNADGSELGKSDVLRINQAAGPVSITANFGGNSRTFYMNMPAVKDVGYICAAAGSFPATSFVDGYSSGRYTISSETNRYIGNIFQKKVTEVPEI